MTSYAFPNRRGTGDGYVFHIHPLPVKTCPVCGKEWEMQCRPDEWGYVHNTNAISKDRQRRVYLCSAPCMREYARKEIEDRVARMKETASYRQWAMRERGMDNRQIAKALGTTASLVASNIARLELYNWQELEWVLEHEEVTA